MPLYEYECFICHTRFERIQKVNADPVKKCPSCGGSVRRLLGVPALQFKGSGWYVTDYAQKDSKAAARERLDSQPSSPSTDKKDTTDSTAAPKKEKTGESKKGTAASG